MRYNHLKTSVRGKQLKAPLIAALAAALCALALAPYERGRQAPTGRTAAPAPRDLPRGGAPAAAPAGANYGAPVVLAHLEDKSIEESSGLAASRLTPGVFWTHNDANGGPVIYAFDRQGKSRGTWRVTGAVMDDWEDIAAGPGPRGRPYLYVGDIGDNKGRRDRIVVYRFPEPAVAGPGAAGPRATEAAEALALKYPDGNHDAETLLVHPRTGDIYVVTKTAESAAGVYKLSAPPKFSGVHTLRRVASLGADGMRGKWLTGGDISPDGRRVVLCDNESGYELELAGADAGFDRVWSQPLAPVPLGERKQGEGVCYSHDGASVLATSEGLPTPLIEVRRSAGRK
jgi:hypothetical protein